MERIDFEAKVWLTLPWKAITPHKFVKERSQFRLCHEYGLIYFAIRISKGNFIKRLHAGRDDKKSEKIRF
jgi:hypothetical protein